MIKYQVIKKTLATSHLALDQIYTEEELSMVHELNMKKIKFLESIKVLKAIDADEEEDQKKRRGRPKK